MKYSNENIPIHYIFTNITSKRPGNELVSVKVTNPTSYSYGLVFDTSFPN